MLPHVLVLSAVVMWGWTFVATKILLAELGPIEIVAMRLAIGLPFLVLLLLVQRVPLRFDRADVPPLLVGGAIVTVHLLLQVVGLVTTTATNSGWIISVTPLALAVLSFLFLRERVGWGVGPRESPPRPLASCCSSHAGVSPTCGGSRAPAIGSCSSPRTHGPPTP
jgi:drug/metabolite transporter (DMT)-like permease